MILDNSKSVNSPIYKTAALVRLASAPPFMIIAVLVPLYIAKTEWFRSIHQLLILCLLMAVLPLCSYIPRLFNNSYKNIVRQEERKRAFLLSLLGYILAGIYVAIGNADKKIVSIISIYVIAVILLSAMNKWMHWKASGHACCVTVPAIVLPFAINKLLLIPCILWILLVGWSSIYMKRHSVLQYASGILTCIVASGISYCIMGR